MSKSEFKTVSPLPDQRLVGFPLSPIEKPPPEGVRTVAECLRHWMTTVVSPNRAQTTVYCYTNIVENHLIPALGRVGLDEVTPELIQRYYQWLMLDRGLSPNTVRKHHVLLHTCLQHAFRIGVLQANPIDRVVPPGSVPGNARYYTPQQVAQLLEEVHGHVLELPVNLACFLGLRRGEILGLRWGDVDLEEGIVTVRAVRTSMGHKVVEKQPKTQDSQRTLSIAPLTQLLSLLQSVKEQRIAAGVPCGPGDPVVLDSRKHPWHPNTLTTTFSDFVAARNMPPITIHGLRHTFASVANHARVPIYDISRTLGHSSPATTQRIYTHLFDMTHSDVLTAVAQAIPAYKKTDSPG